MKKIVNALKSLDIEFQPFIEEINVKEGVIRKCADAATMERVRSTYMMDLHTEMMLNIISIFGVIIGRNLTHTHRY